MYEYSDSLEVEINVRRRSTKKKGGSFTREHQVQGVQWHKGKRRCQETLENTRKPKSQSQVNNKRGNINTQNKLRVACNKLDSEKASENI